LRSEFDPRAAHLTSQPIKPKKLRADLGRMPQRALGIAVGILAIVAVAVFVLLLNRGGDARPLTPDQYRKELAEAFARVDLGADPTEAGALGAYADGLRDLADELEGIVPPADAAQGHGRLVDGLRDYAGQLDSFADAGREGVIRFQQRLAETGGVLDPDWVRAFNELAERGYLTYEPR
jgi:hypothetical protein